MKGDQPFLALSFLKRRAVLISGQRRQHIPSPTEAGQHEAADLRCPMLENNASSTKADYGVHATARASMQEVLGVLGLTRQPCNGTCEKTSPCSARRLP